MARPLDSKELALFLKPPLLITESKEHFASLSAALEQEIKPRGIVERMYVAEIAYYIWEILRWHRCRAAMINAAFEDALERLLVRLLGYVSADSPEGEERAALVRDWFSEPHAKGGISELLAQWHLDKSAIEAEAIRNQAAQLAGFDQMLSLAKSRRDKALRRIADCQDRRFAKQLRDASDRVIEGKTVVQIENRSAKRTA